MPVLLFVFVAYWNLQSSPNSVSCVYMYFFTWTRADNFVPRLYVEVCIH